jgi:putative transposase
MLRSIKIELKVNNKQSTVLSKHAGTARHAYNSGLNYCNNLFNQGIKTPSSIELHKWLVKDIKSKYPWYYEVSKCAPQEALRNLEKAFKNFHRTQKKSSYKDLHYKMVKGVKVSCGLKGLPRFKKKGHRVSFYLDGTIKIVNNTIQLPRIGKLRLLEEFPNFNPKNCTIS